MKILGLSLGALSTAALLVDGRIVACVSEERFSRVKNDETYPKAAIEDCLRQAGLRGDELDVVAVASLQADIWHRLTHYYSRFSIADYVKEQHSFWYPTLYEDAKIAWHEMYRDRWDLEQYPGREAWTRLLDRLGSEYYLAGDAETVANEFIRVTISTHLGVPVDRISFVEHHTGHAAYAYWGSPRADARTCTLTIDAYGDGLSATISVEGDAGLRRVKAISHRDFQLARMYRYTTLLLGMKPNEHEYKVMGLAPYAKPQTLEHAYSVYKSTMYVDGLDFKYHERPRDNYFHFQERLEGDRFDGIAGGLQRYLEEVLVEWVGNALRETGCERVVLSGGVAMNVKAMQSFAALKEVSDIFVPPSGSDESLAIGVCYQLCLERYGVRPQPLADAYLGEDVAAGDVRATVDRLRATGRRLEITDAAPAALVARKLTEGRVVGRCAGRMEFGARALGNRSILADPRRADTVKTLNEKIKNRDFWMPFAPAILADGAHRYVVNPKGLRSPFMTVAFDTTDEGARSLIAASHPSDHTVRPQLLEERANPPFAAIVKAFEEATGVGGVLNTSFNLHGEPIVRTAADAARVFELTEIDDLLLGNTLISKAG